MHIQNNRTFTVTLSEGTTVKQALISLVMAAHRLAEPIEKDLGPLTIGEAAEHVGDDGISAVFLKDRFVLFHLQVEDRIVTDAGDAIVVKLVMFDGDDEKLFLLARDIHDELFGAADIESVTEIGESDIVYDDEDTLEIAVACESPTTPDPRARLFSDEAEPASDELLQSILADLNGIVESESTYVP